MKTSLNVNALVGTFAFLSSILGVEAVVSGSLPTSLGNAMNSGASPTSDSTGAADARVELNNPGFFGLGSSTSYATTGAYSVDSSSSDFYSIDMIGGNDVSVGASFGILSGDSVNGTLSQLTFSFTLGAYETVDVHSNIDYKLDHSGQDDYGEDTIELSWTLEQGNSVSGLGVNSDNIWTAGPDGSFLTTARSDSTTSAAIAGQITNNSGGDLEYTVTVSVILNLGSAANNAGITNDALVGGWSAFDFSATTVVPEPGHSVFLLGAAAACIAMMRRRR